jgi:methyltransferase (TIGR00027 family)
MTETPVSAPTPLSTCLARAVHTRLDRSPLINDAWGDRLVLEDERPVITEALLDTLDAGARATISQLPTGQARLDAVIRAAPWYAGVIVRTRYCEDRLQEAVGGGVRQCVIVGAGMDTLALRASPSFPEVTFFEVDQPAIQELKRQRLRDVQIPLPARLHFVEADLRDMDLDQALARSAFDFTQPSFFLCLGVLVYLPHDVSVATLVLMGKCSAPGSDVVFSYFARQEMEDDFPKAQGMAQTGQAAARAGEPWLSGFDPSQLPSILRSAGCQLVEDLGGADLDGRYCRTRTDGLSIGQFHPVHIAHARSKSTARSLT